MNPLGKITALKKSNKASVPTYLSKVNPLGRIFALKKSGKSDRKSVAEYHSQESALQDRSYKPHQIDRHLVTYSMPQSFEAEQFKMLRTNLLFPDSGKPPRSIMITSVVPGEGKSFVAANLAISIAQIISEHVLLIDCDLRTPCIHKRFGFNDDVPGLSEYLSHGSHFEAINRKTFGTVPDLNEYLSDEVLLSSLFLKTRINKLTLLPGGKPPPNPSELLSSKQMSALLKREKTRYSNRYILIDAPPPKLTTETSVISKQVDGVVLVVKYGKTPRKQVAEVIDILGKERILGIVTNWADTNKTYRMYRKHIGKKMNLPRMREMDIPRMGE